MTSHVKEKFILDATAGFRMMWFNKQHPNCVYLDEKPECEPDIVGDFRHLEQFEDESFKLIVFDPPHILRKTQRCTANMVKAFGQLNPETWESDLKKAFSELWRVLKPYGVLVFKWSNHQLNSNQIIKLAPCKPLFYQVAYNKNKGGRNSIQSLWFCFMKIPEASI